MKTHLPDRWPRARARFASAAAATATLLLWTICVYGALLRFEAFHRAYGPLAGSGPFVRAQAAVAGFASSLHPASLQWPRAEMPYRFDAKSYLVSAREMDQFYEARLREPLFVFATKVGLWLTGGQDIAVSLMSSLFGALLVPATFALGRAVGGVGVGIGAALFVAIEPQLIETGVSGYRDDLFSLLTVLFAWACIRFARHPSARSVLGTGLIGGAACLTRITALTLVVPGLVAAVAFRGRGRWREAVKPAFVAATLIAILIAPFLLNSWKTFGDPLYSINWATAFYGHRSGLESVDDMTTVEFIRRQFDRAPLAMVDSTIRGFTHYPWANKWTELGRHWGSSLAEALKYLCLVGLLMWLWSVEGRVALTVLAGSMVPFVFTWEAHTQWRFTQHAYPFYLVAAVFAAVRPLQWIVSLPRERVALVRAVRGTLVRTTVTAALAAGFFGGMALLPPFGVYHDLAQGRAASVGGDARRVLFVPREVFFFAQGWSGPRTDGNVTFHDAEGGRARLRVPMSGDTAYRCLVRLDVKPVPGGRPATLELRVNDWSGPLSRSTAPEGVASYWTRVPREAVRNGLNRVEIVATSVGEIGRAGSANADVGLRAFSFWYARFFPSS